ncbi:hypothetical protein LZD49_34645 [Dyadobacter sp. CY261]|uniref:hypothetical protein n=1 Tax=Dyadobacter sp. CY261 TaxID=2907203 RepID=UPI001F3EFCA7|nr:hypothetical protein [Dyadobacter sp. CY261]MCF0075663.1 hypothetical protein [Dyadobacter sp. CY261]
METIILTKEEALQLGNFQSGSINFGPLTINWKIDIGIPEIIVDATLYGASIGHVVLNREVQSGTIGGSIGIATAQAKIDADLEKKQLLYEVLVKVLGQVIFDKKGILITW